MQKYLMGGCKTGEARVFSVVPSDRRRVSGCKLKQWKFRLNVSKHFFYYEVGQALRQVA